MSCNGEYMLREEWRRSEAERERLERQMEAVTRLDAKVDELTVAVKDLKRRLAEYDAMCLSARMHDQVFLTAGEVKGLSEAVDFRVGALEGKVKALEERSEAIVARTRAEIVDPDHMDDGMPHDVHPTLVGRVRTAESFLTELNGRVAALEAKLSDDGR